MAPARVANDEYKGEGKESTGEARDGERAAGAVSRRTSLRLLHRLPSHVDPPSICPGRHGSEVKVGRLRCGPPCAVAGPACTTGLVGPIRSSRSNAKRPASQEEAPVGELGLVGSRAGPGTAGKGMGEGEVHKSQGEGEGCMAGKRSRTVTWPRTTGPAKGPDKAESGRGQSRSKVISDR